MKKRNKMILIGITVAILIGAVAWGPMASRVEQAKYEVVQSHDTIEIRQYAPMIVAEVETSGERKEAINQGFRMIADYIFGNNLSAQKVAMTAPVIQQSSEKITMTTPVTQQAEGNAWKVRFVMPAQYTMDTLPKPNNSLVTLKQVEAKQFAVIRFSGTADTETLQEQEQKLMAFVEAEKLSPLSRPTYAFFNPPWTLPFFKRNEVMVEIAK